MLTNAVGCLPCTIVTAETTVVTCVPIRADPRTANNRRAARPCTILSISYDAMTSENEQVYPNEKTFRLLRKSWSREIKICRVRVKHAVPRVMPNTNVDRFASRIIRKRRDFNSGGRRPREHENRREWINVRWPKHERATAYVSEFKNARGFRPLDIARMVSILLRPSKRFQKRSRYDRNVSFSV